MGILVVKTSLTLYHRWSWTIWELMWLSGFCLVFLFFFLPETSSTNILHRRTKRLRKLTGNDKLTCEPDMASEKMGAKDVSISTLMCDLTMTDRLIDFQNDTMETNRTQLPRTDRIPPQSLHRIDLRPAIHLVRILPTRLRRCLRFQSRHSRSRVSRYIGRNIHCCRLPLLMVILLSRETIR